MRVSIPLQANQALRQFFSGRCVAIMDTGVADEVSLTLFGTDQQDAENFGQVGRNFSLFSPDRRFSGIELTSTVATTVQVIVSDYRVETLDGANLTVDVNEAGVSSTDLLAAAIAIGVGVGVAGKRGEKTYQAYGTTTVGAGAATIEIRGRNSAGADWDLVGTLDLVLGVAATSDSFTSNDRYAEVRADVTALSGTGASVGATMGH